MLLDDDVMGHRKAQPRSFSGRLGSEEGIEHLFSDAWRDTGAIVANPDFDRLAEVSGGRAERRLEGSVVVLGLAPGRSIEAVGDEIEQRPGNLLRILRPRRGRGRA
jgi:hypothetical protein